MRFRHFSCAVLTVLVISAASQIVLAAAQEEDRFAPLKRFSQVMDLVENHYVKNVTRGELIDGAIVGMLQQLDPHSSFLTKEEFKEMQVSTSGEFGGIGIEISLENGRLTVISPIDDTPADKAGVKAGDIILEIDDQPTQDMTLVDAVQKIRGPKGKPVSLTILHKDHRPQKAHRARHHPLISVKKTEIEPATCFCGSAASTKHHVELKDAIKDATKSGAPIRGHPRPAQQPRRASGAGRERLGHVSALGQDRVIKGKSTDQRKDFEARGESGEVTAPVVVLINAGSARPRRSWPARSRTTTALLIGEKTFGKGSVQTVIPCPTARHQADHGPVLHPQRPFHPGRGHRAGFQGPLQDVAADRDVTNGMHQFREKDLSRHLENRKDAKGGGDDPAQKIKEQLERTTS
jgi:carboxyl-terminal processing protease